MDTTSDHREAYLTLVQDVVLGRFAPAHGLIPAPAAGGRLRRTFDRLLAARGLELAQRYEEDRGQIEGGYVWPRHAMTMVGRSRLENIRTCLEAVIADGVAGDVIETGVWRGGASIFMRAVLQAHGDTGRRVWVADSFQGLPEPDPERYPADARAYPWHESNDVLGVGLEEVRANFAALRLLDEQVVFLPGFFRDSLPPLINERWALIRLDGDLYESTIQALDALYPNLSVGGWALIDDYGALPECAAAINDYRARHSITEELQTVDYTGVCWQRRRPQA